MFNPNFFKQNRQALQAKVPENSLYIFSSNGLLQRSGSTTYPFRQDNNFWYLTGIEKPDIWLVMDGADEYLVLPKRDPTYEIFNGSLNEAELRHVSAIADAYPEGEGLANIRRALEMADKVVTCLPPESYLEREGFYVNPARQRLVAILQEMGQGIELVDARPAFAELRMVKQPEEIEAIKNALKITEKTFEKVKQRLNSFETEKDIELFITTEFLKSGAAGHAYDPIVASGKNACTLHYIENSTVLQKNDIVLIDAGAELGNYASDITRSYCLSSPSGRQLAVYEAVMEIRSFALSQIKPGINLKDYEVAIEAQAGIVLQRLGLIKSIDHENIRRYYPHATSHCLGLDVHDAMSYDKPLVANMVLTVEPGIYIAEEGLGIRMEDNILVTENGHSILSANLPRQL